LAAFLFQIPIQISKLHSREWPYSARAYTTICDIFVYIH
jgi:hypothetical protein